MNPKTKAGSERTAKKNKRRSPAANFAFTVAKILLIFLIALSCAGVGIMGGAMFGYIKTATPLSDRDLALKDLTTFIYDKDGKEAWKLTGTENIDRVLVYDKDGKIPKYLKDAFVSIEDERFYSHPGIDFKRILSAALNLLKPGSSAYGGSTITQQVVKVISGDDEVSLRRKVQEWYKAIELEKRYEKWQILELYMNLIYLGNGSYGIEAASEKYFSKPVDQLTIAEAASIAGITQSPTLYNPYTEKGRIRNKKRQELVLGKMLENQFITKQQYDEAINQKLEFADKDKVVQKTIKIRPYFVDQVINDVIKDLKAKGLSDQMAKIQLYSGGLQIYTTMDSKAQDAMDEVFKDDKYFPGGKRNGKPPQAAMVIIDPTTGEVRAMYGGHGAKTGDLILNRATQIKRSAGSSFKPIAEYAPAIDQRKITAGTVVDDAPVYMLGTKEGLYPKNFTRDYRGLTTIRDAIKRSVNIVAAKVWMDLGPDLSLDYLKRVGIDRDQRNLSIALGGLTEGVSPEQMAAAYVPFAHKGLYYEPITYTKVVDAEGNVLVDKKKDSKIKQKSNIAYDEATAFIMSDMLKDVIRAPEGTARYIKLSDKNKVSIPVAAKTGTSNDDKDRWFVAFTTYYTGAVWYGYDKPTEVALPSSSRNPSAVIWNAVMQKIYSKLDTSKIGPTDFAVPSGVVKKTICIDSGKAPSELCYKDPRGSRVRDEYFIKGTEPKDEEKCDVHVLARIDTTSKDQWGKPLLAGQYCPPSVVAERVFIRRKVPFMPSQPNDPYPTDSKYEVPNEYCNIHGAPVEAPKTNVTPKEEKKSFWDSIFP